MKTSPVVQLNEIIQKGFPLVRNPFKYLSKLVDLPSGEIRNHILQLQKTGLVREISGIFDAGKLGYDQALIAMKLSQTLLEDAGKIVQKHPGISHCYQRSDEYNFWFTLAVFRFAPVSLHQVAGALAGKSRADSWLILPTAKKFKLNVMFDINNPGCGLLAETKRQIDTQIDISSFSSGSLYRKAVCILQSPAPLENRCPFEALACQNGMDVDQLLYLANEMKDAGVLRRYCAVINHRQAGAQSNVMVVWNVEADKVEAAAEIASRFQSVSHCYIRKSIPGWPFNLYTMIHGANRSRALDTVSEIRDQVGCNNYKLLWTEREFKKQRLQLFV